MLLYKKLTIFNIYLIIFLIHDENQVLYYLLIFITYSNKSMHFSQDTIENSKSKLATFILSR
jgi:hypothetical protein